MSTLLQRHIRASPSAVYAALVDATAVQQWMVPDGMVSTVHEYDARPGGSFRITLTYDEPTTSGKTDSHSDTLRALHRTGAWSESRASRRVRDR